MKHKAQTSGFPWVRCCAEDCWRCTSRIKPIEDGRVWLDTGTADPGWICGEHWRRVPKRLKARHRALVRRLRHFWPDGGQPANRAAWMKANQVMRLIVKSHQMMVRAATAPLSCDLAEIERIFGVDR